jgi:enoyl-CoA hydratase/carnithine racemase
MMLSNEPVSAATALDWGMINDCVAKEALMPTANQLAKKLANEAEKNWRDSRFRATQETHPSP